MRPSDVRRVIDAAKAVAIPMDREVIHVIPQEFIIDDQDGIREPLGMSGVRLEAKIHIVTAAVTSAQNIVKCANKAGLNVIDIVLEPLASAEAVPGRGRARARRVPDRHRRRHHRHRRLRATASIKHTSVLGLGGVPPHERHRGRPAHAVRGGRAHQEEVRRGGARFLGERRRDQRCRASAGAGPREVSRKLLCEIIEPRVDEILSLVRQELVKAGSRTASRPASCSPAAARRSRACPSSPRRSSRRRCGSASRPRRRPAGRGARARCTRPASASCCSAPRRTAGKRQPLPDPRRVDLRAGQAAHARLVLRGVRVETPARDSANRTSEASQETSFVRYDSDARIGNAHWGVRAWPSSVHTSARRRARVFRPDGAASRASIAVIEPERRSDRVRRARPRTARVIKVVGVGGGGGNALNT